jgi:rod shape-determining protein MreC
MSKKRLRLVILIGGIFLAPLALFSTKLNIWKQQDPGDAIFQELTYPFTWLWHTTFTGIASNWSRYIALNDAQVENESLKAQLLNLKVKLLDYEEQSLEVSRLRTLVNFSAKIEDKYTVAEVITGQKDSIFKAIRISKGSLDGVAAGMPVITTEGVVGKVIRVGLKMADVQLIVDYDSNIDILIQRSRIRGVLSGFANEECRLQLQRGTEIKIGDTLITSGIVGSFPKGVPVGRVVKISFENDNVSQVITVEPWVDHRRLEEVVILLRPDPELARIVETAGKEWLDKTVNTDAIGGTHP